MSKQTIKPLLLRSGLVFVVLLVLVVTAFTIHQPLPSKHQRLLSPTTERARSSFIEVEPHVKLHVTDWGAGTPVVLIHGYPLSDASWEY